VLWYSGSNNLTRRWLMQDNQGSVVGWFDNSGHKGDIYAYSPWGEPQGGVFTGSRFRYTGQLALPEASLYHYKARAYDPARGWFLQTDPEGYKDDLDLYAYVKEDPVDHVDPAGLACADVCDPVSVQALNSPSGQQGQKLAVEVGVTVATAIPAPELAPEVAAAEAGAEGGFAVYRGSQLARAMDEAGHGVVQGAEHAHHIVAQGAKAAAPARAVLARVGIGIHSAENGAAIAKGAHQGLHTAEYYEQINVMIQAAEKKGKEGVMRTLDDIRKAVEDDRPK
jgi:RHS repeat-associated protein